MTSRIARRSIDRTCTYYMQRKTRNCSKVMTQTLRDRQSFLGLMYIQLHPIMINFS